MAALLRPLRAHGPPSLGGVWFPGHSRRAVLQELYALQLRCSAGDAGPLGRGELFAIWRDWTLYASSWTLDGYLWHPCRGPPWASLGSAGSKAHGALCGWLEAQGMGLFVMGTSCLGCVGLCAECFAWRHNCTHCGEKRKMLYDA